ncbi:MAG: hypothetical protein IH999_04020 [Proteobacteria bacterium]|nr:hypothetical protein [Pseudomonadota bacterium]
MSARTFSFEETPVVKVAAWNVNSIRARLPRVLDWLRQAVPDVVLLQETKTVAERFCRRRGAARTPDISWWDFFGNRCSVGSPDTRT